MKKKTSKFFLMMWHNHFWEWTDMLGSGKSGQLKSEYSLHKYDIFAIGRRIYSKENCINEI